MNDALQRLEEGIAAVTTVPIAGTATTLTATNYTADQARSACLVFTGTLTAASTVTVPNVEKLYLCINSTSGSFSLTVKTAAGTGYALRAGPNWVYCDGTNVAGAVPRLDQAPLATASVDLNAQKITNLGTPTTTTDAATKAYVDAIGGGVASVYQPGAGSAAVPSYTFSTDTNTGMYSAGADTLAFSTAGVNRVNVGADGDVAVGRAAYNVSSYRNLCVQGTNGGILDLRDSTGSAFGRIYSDTADSSLRVVNDKAGPIVLLPGSGSERARLTAVGDFVIGSSSVPSGGTLAVAISKDGWRSDKAVTTSTFHAQFYNPNGIVGSITTSGSTTSFVTSSDYRLKRDVELLTGALDRLALLKPRRFAFKAAPGDRMDGFIAHEVSAAVPEAVFGEKDGDMMQGVDATKIIPLLVAAVQDLAARVEALEGA